MANDPLIGKTIGGCEILEVIGQGGMGVIYRSRQKSLDRVVALKVLARHLASDINFVARFQKEARAIARVNHPNILAVYDVGDDQGVNYMIMELIDGQSLAEIQSERRGALPWEEAADFVRQSASGLEAAQSVGIIHRDIKPENLMITKKGVIKVSDFGLAKEADSGSMNTSVDAVMGTPAFMSPEQCDGKKVDGRSDVYSLGGTFYKLVCGRLPFEAETAMSMMYRHKHEALIPPHEVVRAIPETVSQIVVKMMAKKREHRFQTMTEVIEAIDNVRGSRVGAAGRSQQALNAVPAPMPVPVAPPLSVAPMSPDEQRRGTSIYANAEELPPRSVGHTQKLQIAGSGPFSSEAESSSRLDMPSGMISFAGGAQQDEGYTNVQRGDDLMTRGDRMGALKCYRAAAQSRTLDQATRTRIEGELRKEIATRKQGVETLIKRSMLVEASRECRILTELDPADENAKALMKDLDQKLGQKRTLINDIRTAIAGSQFERGISLWDATPPELRDEAMGKQIEQLRSVVLPSNKLSEQGESFITQGRLEDAVSSFEDAIKVNPACEAARLGLKEAQQKIQRIEFMLKEGFQANLEQDYEKAIDTWKPILTLRPGHPQAVKSIVDASIAHAQNLKAHGDLDGALAAYQTAHEADPQNRTVKRSLEDLTNLADKHRALIERAQDSAAHGRLGEAIGYWKEVRRINPANKKAQQQLDSLGKQRSGGLARTFVILALLGAVGLAAYQFWTERQIISSSEEAIEKGKYGEISTKLDGRFIFLKAAAEELRTRAGMELEVNEAEQLVTDNKLDEASKLLAELAERFQPTDKFRAQALRVRAREVMALRLRRALDETLAAERWPDVNKVIIEADAALKGEGINTEKLNALRARIDLAKSFVQHWMAYQTISQGNPAQGSEDLKKVVTLAGELGLTDIQARAEKKLAEIDKGTAHVKELYEKGIDALRKSPPDWKTAKEFFEELQRAESSPRSVDLIRYARDIGYCTQEKGDMALVAAGKPAEPNGAWGNNERAKSFCVDRYEYPNKAGEIPTGNMTWLEAKKACETAGKKLCATTQWTDACRAGLNSYPYGNAYVKDTCNTEGSAAAAAGSKAACVNALGLFDMSGNLAEWTDGGDANEATVMGGYFGSARNSNCLDGQQEATKAKSANIGFRCCAPLPPKN